MGLRRFIVFPLLSLSARKGIEMLSERLASDQNIDTFCLHPQTAVRAISMTNSGKTKSTFRLADLFCPLAPYSSRRCSLRLGLIPFESQDQSQTKCYLPT